ncbi:MAG TPA: L-threonylcarbamoyladenylate synthase [Pyrinomonadaceae bacterium]|nr:L-threonylcarbamoyladenylate synthase [Pyrinomonadaceae bacterium]
MIQPDKPNTRIHAAAIIAAGGVIAFRTDTFYGLGADPLNADAVSKVRLLKSREDDKPILLLISDMNQVERFIAEPSETFRTIAERYWPAPITLVGLARSDLPIELTAGTNSIGLRLPDDENVRSLVRACGGSLTATSANPSARPPATTAQEVVSYFPSSLDLIIDGGEVTLTEPSTVVDLMGATPRLIREGAIKLEELDILDEE